tara:strand:+ start:358 stop:825 length:468 start_codon:yes stop_codon:yes gene_type:complete
MSKVIVVVDAVDINGTEQKKYDNIFYNNILSKYLAIETSNGTEVIFFTWKREWWKKFPKYFDWVHEDFKESISFTNHGELSKYLLDKDEIIFCGFHLNQCVERDAKILKNLGHNIHIVVNMCSVLMKDMSQDFFDSLIWDGDGYCKVDYSNWWNE